MEEFQDPIPTLTVHMANGPYSLGSVKPRLVDLRDLDDLNDSLPNMKSLIDRMVFIF